MDSFQAKNILSSTNAVEVSLDDVAKELRSNTAYIVRANTAQHAVWNALSISHGTYTESNAQRLRISGADVTVKLRSAVCKGVKRCSQCKDPKVVLLACKTCENRHNAKFNHEGGDCPGTYRSTFDLFDDDNVLIWVAIIVRVYYAYPVADDDARRWVVLVNDHNHAMPVRTCLLPSTKQNIANAVMRDPSLTTKQIINTGRFGSFM